MIIRSILDTDLYKLCMGMCIAHHYPRVPVTYEFINRGGTKFPDGFGQRLRQEVDSMRELHLTSDEEAFLRDKCYYLKPNYIDMFRAYRFDPTQVNIRQVGSKLFITIRGPWYLTVYWEVPLMALISELYYEMTKQPPRGVARLEPKQFPNGSWEDAVEHKYRRMDAAGIILSEFGTRRRHSYAVQDYVIKTGKDHRCLAGTSNVHLAYKHGLTPHGTMAHEWVSAHACMFGYRMATKMMLERWVDVYEGELGTALPDTFTTGVFFSEFSTLYAKLFDGIRWDSGDWKWFTDSVVDHYKKLRIDPMAKSIVYSDGLDIDQALEIQEYAEGKIQARFGIGTNLTNSVGRIPLNMVIKLVECDGRPAVKLSDSPGKMTGTPEEIVICKQVLGLQ